MQKFAEVRSNLTLEELERRAYADGDTATAELLRRALDEIAEARAQGYAKGHADGYAEKWEADTPDTL